MLEPVRIVAAPIGKGRAFATGMGTKIYSGDTEIHGIASIDVSFRPDELVTAKMELYVWPKEINNALPEYWMTHPLTGEKVRIVAIDFDGCERLELC